MVGWSCKALPVEVTNDVCKTAAKKYTNTLPQDKHINLKYKIHCNPSPSHLDQYLLERMHLALASQSDEGWLGW